MAAPGGLYALVGGKPKPSALNSPMPGLLRTLWVEPPVRAMLLLAVLMFAVLVGATAFLLHDMRAREIEYARAEIASLSHILAEQTSRTLDGVALALRGAQDRLSDGIGLELELDSFPVLAMLKVRSEGLPQFSSMFVLDADGVVMNSTLLGSRPGLTEHDRDYFSALVAADGGLFVSRMHRRRFDGEWAFYLSVRLVDAKGDFRGVIAAAIPASYFESFYRQLDLRFGKQIRLINARGRLVASFPSDGEQSGRPPEDEAKGGTTGDPVGAAVVTEKVEGHTRFTAYHPVARYPFLVGVAVDEDSALMSWPMSARSIVWGAGIVAVLLLAASCGVVWSMRRRAMLVRALQDSDERLREMVESVMDAIVTVDENRSIVLFNRAAERMFGVAAQDVLGKSFDGLLAAGAPPACCAFAGGGCHPEALEKEVRGRVEIVGRHADGHEFPADVSFSSSEVQGERFVTVVLRDLTERKRIENHLRETNRQLQDVSASLQRVREDERAGIAREMHDELGQRLTAIKLELSWLGGRLPLERRDLQDKVGVVKEQLNETIASVRRITYELRPLILDDLGLRAAVSWLTGDFAKRTNVELVLDLGIDEPAYGSPEATTLFRVLQESLTNITKYAQAKTVWIVCRLEGSDWRLTVRDDGTGFVLDAIRQAGFGLIGMRERVRLLQGTFVIHSAPGDGTTIDVTVPA